ncbi:YhdP family protein [Microbulbifer discodermiae]|uniref:YhdP family protein n=1 Tax=Microbulbifer sp. 2201CG32-9 TaxID=3232309 RepID=UPI00345C3092
MRALRWLARKFWLLVITLVIALALMVQTGRLLSPQVERYRPQISDWLGEQLGVPVQVAGLSLRWRALEVALELHNLRLGDAGQVQMGFGLFHLDLLASLWNRELVWKNLEVHDFSAAIRQLDNGRWHIEGFPIPAAEPPAGSGGSTLALGDPARIFQLSPKVLVRDAALAVRLEDGGTAQLNVPQVLLEYSGNFRRLSARAFLSRDSDDTDAPPVGRETLRLILEGRGNPRDRENFALSGYLHLDDLQVDEEVITLLHQLTPVPERFHWTGSKLASGSLWLSSDSQVGYRLQGQVSLAQVGEAAPVAEGDAEASADSRPPLLAPLQSLAGDISGQWQPGQNWQLALQDVRLDWRDQPIPALNLLVRNDEETGLRLSADRLELGAWSRILRRLQVLQGPARDWLEALAPEGRLESIQFARGVDGKITLAANLVDVTAQAHLGAPAVRGLSGYLELQGANGRVDLDSGSALDLHFPKLYPQGFEFERTAGSVAWHVDRDRNSVQVYSGELQMDGALGQVAGQFLLRLPFTPGSRATEFTLALGLRDAPVSAQGALVPVTTSESLRAWLDGALGADNPGRVPQAAFIYRGYSFQKGDDAQLLALGRHAERQTVQLQAEVSQGRIDYAPGWPTAREVDARLLVNDRNVQVSASAAKLWDITARNIEVALTPAPLGEGSLLGVRAQVAGPAQSGLRLLRDSPLREHLGDAFDSWELDGDLSGSLTLSQPLGGSSLKPQQTVQVDLREGKLQLGDLRLDIEELAGRVLYDSDGGLSGTRLNGSLWGRPLTAEIEHPGQGSQRDTQVVVRGSADVAAVGDWSGRPELKWLDGIFDYRTLVTIPARTKEMPYAAVVEVTTDLKGVAVNLPPPLDKTAEERSNLVLRVPVGEQGSLYHLSYGEQLQGRFWQVGGELVRGNIALNTAAKLPTARELSITGDLSQVDLTSWRRVLEVYDIAAEGQAQGEDTPAADSSPLPVTLDLGTDRLILGQKEIANLHARGRGVGADWRIDFDSETASGQFSGILNAETPLQLKLRYLRLPAPKASEKPSPESAEGESEAVELVADPWSGFDFSSLPQLDFSADSVSLGEEDLGPWSFRLRPSADRLVLSDIRGTARGITVEGRGSGEDRLGAQLMWLRHPDGSESSQFIGALRSADLADVQKAWGQEPAIESEYARFDTALSWSGSPAAAVGKQLVGELKIDIRKGRFLRSTGSAGSALLRLLSLFNFDTWARRLRLDFSDLYQSGMAFDRVRGEVNFEGDGQLLIAVPIQVDGPTSELQMAGQLNVAREDLDLTLVATLPVGNNLALVAAIAGGLPAAAGVYLISKVFKKQVNKVASVSYRISGDWADPDIRFDKMFDDEGAQRQGSAASEQGAKPDVAEWPGPGTPSSPPP